MFFNLKSAALAVMIALSAAPAGMMAQKAGSGVATKYAAGAVPVVDGKVEFSQSFELPGKSKSEIYNSLLTFAQSLTKEEGAGEQSRVSRSDEANGLVAVNMEEMMYFKRTGWVTNATRFYYQLLFEVSDGGYKATLRNIHYLYDEEHNGGITYSAEEWITDDKALVKHGRKLSRYSGKFRTATIDRKDELFTKAYSAAGGKIKKRVKKIVYEEVEE